jgi:hypothetical protein
LYQPWGRSCHKKSLFLDVTSGEIQEQSYHELETLKLWAFSRAPQGFPMQLTGDHEQFVDLPVN